MPSARHVSGFKIAISLRVFRRLNEQGIEMLTGCTKQIIQIINKYQRTELNKISSIGLEKWLIG